MDLMEMTSTREAISAVSTHDVGLPELLRLEAICFQCFIRNVVMRLKSEFVRLA